MKTKILLCTLLSAIVAMTVSCAGNGTAASNDDDELKGSISISGAFALYPLAVKWAEEFQMIHPKIRIDLSAGGAGKGMTDVLADVVDLGMVSREVYDAELQKGALPIATAKDAVVITFNADNPYAKELMKKGFSKETATKIWISGQYTTWGQVLGTNDETPIHVYTRSDACGAAETFALWMERKQEDLLGTAVFGDPGLASAVQGDKLAIGFNNIGYAYDEKSRKPNPGLLVMPVDGDNSGEIEAQEYFYDTKDDFIAAVAEGKYPSPPARDLYLVCHGVPQNPVVKEFLEFVLGDGQKHNIPAGYISMSEEKIQQGLEKIRK